MLWNAVHKHPHWKWIRCSEEFYIFEKIIIILEVEKKLHNNNKYFSYMYVNVMLFVYLKFKCCKLKAKYISVDVVLSLYSRDVFIYTVYCTDRYTTIKSYFVLSYIQGKWTLMKSNAFRWRKCHTAASFWWQVMHIYRSSRECNVVSASFLLRYIQILKSKPWLILILIICIAFSIKAQKHK